MISAQSSAVLILVACLTPSCLDPAEGTIGESDGAEVAMSETLEDDTLHDASSDLPDAQPASPCVKVSPEDVAFGGKPPGQQTSLDVVVVNCGTTAVTMVDARLMPVDGALSPDFGVALPQALPVTLQAGAAWTLQVSFAPSAFGGFGPDGKPIIDAALLEIAFEDAPVVTVDVTGFGVCEHGAHPVIEITEGTEVAAGTPLHLSGFGSYACVGEISKYQWNVAGPQGNAAIFLPSASSPNPSFTVDVPGTYVFQLDVWDSSNEKSYVAAEYEVVVTP